MPTPLCRRMKEVFVRSNFARIVPKLRYRTTRTGISVCLHRGCCIRTITFKTIKKRPGKPERLLPFLQERHFFRPPVKTEEKCPSP